MRRTSKLIYMLSSSIFFSLLYIIINFDRGNLGDPKLFNTAVIIPQLDLIAAKIAEPFIGEWDFSQAPPVAYEIKRAITYCSTASVLTWIAQKLASAGRYIVAEYRNFQARGILGNVHASLASCPAKGDSDNDSCLIAYYLFLRPFTSTGILGVSHPLFEVPPLTPEQLAESDHSEDLESRLSDALTERGPLIALGKPGEHFGAGRIEVTDAVWQQEFAILAKSADRIFVVPSATPGCMWELNWLKRHRLLNRCLFLSPPASTNIEERTSEWASAADRLHAVGIELPGYDKRGKWFAVTETGCAVELSRPRPRDWSTSGLNKWLDRNAFTESRKFFRAVKRKWLNDTPLTPAVGVALSWAAIFNSTSAPSPFSYVAAFLVVLAFLGFWYNFPNMSRVIVGMLTVLLLPVIVNSMLYILFSVVIHKSWWSRDILVLIGMLSFPINAGIFSLLTLWIFGKIRIQQKNAVHSNIKYFAIMAGIFAIGPLIGGAYSWIFTALGAQDIHYLPFNDARIIAAAITGFLAMRLLERHLTLPRRELPEMFSARVRGWSPRWWTTSVFVCVVAISFASTDARTFAAAGFNSSESVYSALWMIAISLGITALFCAWLSGKVTQAMGKTVSGLGGYQTFAITLCALITWLGGFFLVGYFSWQGVAPFVTTVLLVLTVIAMGAVISGWIAWNRKKILLLSSYKSRFLLYSTFGGSVLIGSWYMLLIFYALHDVIGTIVVALAGGRAFSVWIADNLDLRQV
jgi:hypothetical protein